MKIYRLKKKTLPKLAVLATGLVVAATAATIQAIPAQAHVGYTQNCSGCHTAGGSVTATPSSATPKAGAAYTVALKFTGGSSPSGFWISGNGANVTGASSTSASMTAPAAAGTYTYTAWVRAGVVASTTYKITVAPVVTTPPTTVPPTTVPPTTVPPTTVPPTTVPPTASSTLISSLSPSHGLVGTRITITGKGFARAGVVKFGSVSATVSSWTSTRIVVSVPNVRSSSRVLVTVTPAAGRASNGVSFRIDANHGDDNGGGGDDN